VTLGSLLVRPDLATSLAWPVARRAQGPEPAPTLGATMGSLPPVRSDPAASLAWPVARAQGPEPALRATMGALPVRLDRAASLAWLVARA